MTDTRRPPRPPDIDRRTLTTVGYALCIAVPVLIAAVGLLLLHLNYDKDDLVTGERVELLTSDWEPGDVSQQALVTGELTLDDDSCVRVGGEAVVWPADYVASVERGESDRLRVYDPDRNVVALGGDSVELSGGYGGVGAYGGRACAPDSGDIFFVQSDITVVQGP